MYTTALDIDNEHLTRYTSRLCNKSSSLFCNINKFVVVVVIKINVSSVNLRNPGPNRGLSVKRAMTHQNFNQQKITSRFFVSKNLTEFCLVSAPQQPSREDLCHGFVSLRIFREKKYLW